MELQSRRRPPSATRNPTAATITPHAHEKTLLGQDRDGAEDDRDLERDFPQVEHVRLMGQPLRLGHQLVALLADLHTLGIEFLHLGGIGAQELVRLRLGGEGKALPVEHEAVGAELELGVALLFRLEEGVLVGRVDVGENLLLVGLVAERGDDGQHHGDDRDDEADGPLPPASPVFPAPRIRPMRRAWTETEPVKYCLWVAAVRRAAEGGELTHGMCQSPCDEPPCFGPKTG